MKKSLILLALIWFWTSSIGQAADFVWFSTSTQTWKNKGRCDFLEGRLSASVLDSLDKIYHGSPNRYIVYEKGGSLFVQVSCTFDLYEIQAGQLSRKYLYFNKGYTCATTPFVREDTHYLLGGHGFWRNHMDLMAFDELHGSWELVITGNQPPNYFSPFIFQNSKGLFSLFGQELNPRHVLDKKITQGYFLDWQTKEWKEIELVIEGLEQKDLVEKGGLYFIQTQDYAFWASTSGLENIGWNLIKKESGKIFYFNSKNVDMGISSYLEIVGNVLTYAAPSGELKTMDLDQIRQKSEEVGYVKVREAAAIDIKSAWWVALFFVLVAIGWLVVKKALSKKKVEVAEVQSPLKEDPIHVLLSYSGQVLTTETLDQLLGIDEQINFDSKRMKRARHIKTINERYLVQKGKELIVREKKADDKRYVFYKIQA